MDDFILAEQIKADLQALPENFIVLFIVSPQKYFDSSLAILQNLINEKQLSGLYITVNKPYQSIFDSFKHEGIDVSKLFFVDAITKRATNEPEKHENVLYLSGPQNLTDLGIVIEQATQSMEGKQKFLFLDSISTLQVYNSVGTVASFTHFLTAKLRGLGIKGVFIGVRHGTDEQLIELVSQFGDKIYYVDGES